MLEHLAYGYATAYVSTTLVHTTECRGNRSSRTRIESIDYECILYIYP